MIDDNIKAAATRAADWLEANPDKHIARSLAIDSDNFPVSPSDPRADCFCALGRLAKELNLDVVGTYGRINDVLGYDLPEQIFTANDAGSRTRFDNPDFSRRIAPADPAAGIRELRKLAR